MKGFHIQTMRRVVWWELTKFYIFFSLRLYRKWSSSNSAIFWVVYAIPWISFWIIFFFSSSFSSFAISYISSKQKIKYFKFTVYMLFGFQFWAAVGSMLFFYFFFVLSLFFFSLFDWQIFGKQKTNWFFFALLWWFTSAVSLSLSFFFLTQCDSLDWQA